MYKTDLSVAMIIDRYAPLWGGTENQLRQMVPHLKKRGCNAFIVTRRWDKKLAAKELIDGVPIYRVGRPGKNFLSTASYVAALFITLFNKRKSFGIIHTNGAAALAVLGGFLGLFLKKPNVARISSASRVPGLAQKPYGPIAMKFMRSADAIVSLSDDIHNELLNVNVAKNRICDMNNGVDCERFKKYSEKQRQTWRLQRHLPEDAMLVIYSSLFKPGKGHVMLLKAWRQIEEQVENAWLLLLGSDNYQRSSTAQQIMATARQEKLKRVIFEGETATPEAYMGVADICAFAAEDDSEGCPNALIEAMAAQLPPVAFNASGVRDIIKHRETGLLVSKKNSDAFAEKLMELIRSEDQRHIIGKNARKYVMEHYDFSVVADKYITMYNTVR